MLLNQDQDLLADLSIAICSSFLSLSLNNAEEKISGDKREKVEIKGCHKSGVRQAVVFVLFSQS